MKRTTLTSFTILCLLTTLVLMGHRTSAPESPRVIHVPTDYPTIQQAIDKAHTYSKDTIYVHKRTYFENIVVYKSVSLLGEDIDLTIIDGGGNRSVISVTADNVTIKGFTIRNSGSAYSDSGIYISSIANNISNNTITNNTRGVHLYSSSNNIVSSNNISSNNIAIHLRYSKNNTICGNTISNNINGIHLDYFSDDNTIYHNNFIDNIDQVWSESTNIWDSTIEGNYWSDYTEQDLNEDGIGDHPYVIDMNNQDHCPLMGNFANFSVTCQGKTHQITTVSNSRISNLTFEIGTKTGNRLSFDVAGEEGTIGLCRVMIPTQLMNYSYIVFVDGKETIPTMLDASNKTHAYIYFTYLQSSHTITIISSKLLYLHNELLNEYLELQIDFHKLNLTYYELFDAYIEVLGNYSQLLERYSALNASYQEHLLEYYELQANHTSLLLEQAQNIRNLLYTFIATTAIFIAAAVYLSTHAHRKAPRS